MGLYSYGGSSRVRIWRQNDWSSLFTAQRRLFEKENKTAHQLAKIGEDQRTEIIRLLSEAQLLWEAATYYQQRARDAHANGNPILAQAEMLEARRLAQNYARMTEECQRIITEAQAMALSEREIAAAERRRLRQEFALRYMNFV